MGLKLIGVSCLEVGVLHPSILKTERPPRHLISAGLIPHHEHLLARSALPRERVRSVTQICRRRGAEVATQHWDRLGTSPSRSRTPRAAAAISAPPVPRRSGPRDRACVRRAPNGTRTAGAPAALPPAG